MSYKNELKNVEIERETIAGILRFPQALSDLIPFVSSNSFTSQVYKNCFDTMVDLYKKGEEINPYSVANKILALNITNVEIQGGSLKEHLEEIKTCISINEKGVLEHSQKLLKLEMLRERAATAENVLSFLKEKGNIDRPIDEIITFADRLWEGNISFFTRSGGKEFTKIFDIAESVIEERGANPIKEFGYYSPFERFNFLYDAMWSPGDIHLTASASNTGKTSYGFFNSLHVIEKYKVPLLWLDSGEMLETQLIRRSICAMTRGQVSTYMLKTGLWRKDPRLTALVRSVWPRVQKIKDLFYFRNVGGMKSEEVCSVINRFWLSTVGRFSETIPTFGSKLGPCFPVNLDYFKGMGSNKESPEWQEVGRSMENMKTLITTTCPAAIKTYLQLNRSGTTRGKSSKDVNDSESAFAVSQRVYENISNGYILRYKTKDELAKRGPEKFGNCKLLIVKKRDLGEGYKEASELVKMPDGSVEENYLHLNQESFHWECLGDLASTVDEIGQLGADEENNDEDVELG